MRRPGKARNLKPVAVGRAGWGPLRPLPRPAATGSRTCPRGSGQAQVFRNPGCLSRVRSGPEDLDIAAIFSPDGRDVTLLMTAVNAGPAPAGLAFWRQFPQPGRDIMIGDRSRIWALAMNGARARVLRGLHAHGNGEPAELVMRSEARRLRDIMSDKPGRSFSSGSIGRRSAMAYASDPVAEDQRDFIRQVIALLESHRRAGEFDSLVILAEHDVLGNLRHMMPHPLHDMVLREVPKNLLHLPAADLHRAILAELTSAPQVPG